MKIDIFVLRLDLLNLCEADVELLFFNLIKIIFIILQTMADIQVLRFSNIALKIFPKTIERFLKLKKIAREKNLIWS